MVPKCIALNNYFKDKALAVNGQNQVLAEVNGRNVFIMNDKIYASSDNVVFWTDLKSILNESD